jgi:hypothetical protein
MIINSIFRNAKSAASKYGKQRFINTKIINKGLATFLRQYELDQVPGISKLITLISALLKGTSSG